MPIAHVNGIDLYYQLHGEGPAVIFAHGSGGNHLSWWQQAPFFTAHGYACVTFDHRGFGLSKDEPAGPGASAFADDLLGLLDHLALERVYLVAQSMGGRTALRLALLHPERVLGLVMAGAIGNIVSDAIRSRYRELRAAEADGDGLARRPRRVFHPDFRRQRPHMAFLYRQISALNPERPPNFARVRSQDELLTGEALAHMTTPSLFIVGDHDAITPPGLVALAQPLVPNSRLLVVPKAGHSVYFEKPEFFNETALAFFRDVNAMSKVAQ